MHIHVMLFVSARLLTEQINNSDPDLLTWAVRGQRSGFCPILVVTAFCSPGVYVVSVLSLTQSPCDMIRGVISLYTLLFQILNK